MSQRVLAAVILTAAVFMPPQAFANDCHHVLWAPALSYCGDTGKCDSAVNVCANAPECHGVVNVCMKVSVLS